MGNVALCAPSIISNSEVKVLSSDGRLVIYTNTPTKAGEIMLKNPGQFLCESSNLKVGQRIVGLCAEEELERGELYFLLPMEMLYSVLTNEEMKYLSHKGSKGIKHAATLNYFSKIFPEFCLFPSNNSEAREMENSETCCNLEANERYSRQRSWQPALETIVETPPHT